MKAAFAPANVSCIFRTYYGDDALSTGSHGLGFTLEDGVVVEASKGGSEIIVDSVISNFPTVSDVARKLAPSEVRLEIKSSMEFGSGFGLSGASALATAYALNELFDLGKNKSELALIAHVAEVENGTGLGDVAGQLHGGIMLRVDEGEPLSVRNLDISANKIYYKVFGPIETREVISSEEKRKLIDQAGASALNAIQSLGEATFEDLVEVSKVFSYESGLLKSEQVIEVIEDVERRGGRASMIMLGEAVFSTIEFEGCKRANILKSGARVL